jgi:hypothetical protein
MQMLGIHSGAAKLALYAFQVANAVVDGRRRNIERNAPHERRERAAKLFGKPGQIVGAANRYLVAYEQARLPGDVD